MALGRTALEIETVLKRQISCHCFEVLFRAVMSRKVLKDEKMWISSSGANSDSDFGAMLPEIWYKEVVRWQDCEAGEVRRSRCFLLCRRVNVNTKV